MAAETSHPPPVPVSAALGEPEPGGETVQIIEPGGTAGLAGWAEVWRYRELLYFLTWRDVKIRYKQTALGAAWAILQPLLQTLIFYFVFGRMAGLREHTGGVPYPLFVFAGLLPWTFFANAVTASGNSVVGSTNLVTKVYFPRLVIPLAAVGASVVDMAISGLVLLGLMVWYAAVPGPAILLAPVFLVGILVAACGVGTLLSALVVAYRDFRYVVPYTLQIWMFLTPVMYPTSVLPIPPGWRWVLALNPLAGLVDGFRAALVGAPLDPMLSGVSLVTALAALGLGAAYFRRVERRFADVI